MKTIGLSPKALLAFLFPAIAALGAAVTSWIVTGDFNANEIRVAAGGLITAAVGGMGAVIGRPGTVAPRVPDEPGNDALMPATPPAPT